MKIHKEGRSFLMYLLILLLVTNIALIYFSNFPQMVLNIIGIISAGLFLFFLQFFRDPKINVVINPSQILAPADGKVVVIEKTTETEYLKEERIQVSIFMSPINVHVNRNPVSGIIKYFKYHPGKYLVAWHPKSSTENERTTIVYELSSGLQILIRQIAGAMARRIKCYLSVGDETVQGEQFGFIKFGSRVDVFLPLDARVMVDINDTTTAGKTIIAEL